MDFYSEKDLQYWKRQAQEGKAVILEIPVSMLLDLDIRSLSREPARTVSMEDLEKWITENKEAIDAALEKERNEKSEVEKLEKSLYDGQDMPGRTETSPKDAPAASAAAGNAMTDEKASAEVARIMRETSFSDDQIAVIALAMVEELPDKYLLCFMKEEYSPEVMRKLKDYCTKLYQEEVKERNGKHSK